MSKLAEVKELYSYYGGICALNGISLYINEGEITSIIGSNGAGKSTFMRTIAGDKAINSGEILLRETAAHECAPGCCKRHFSGSRRTPYFSRAFRPRKLNSRNLFP